MTEVKPARMIAPLLPDGLDTPESVVDLDIVERNARQLQSALDERGVALRPHVKTHKSPDLARLQLDAGARGITVGNLGEAEVFADAGFDDIFIAYPISRKGRRSIGCARWRPEPGLLLSVGFDSIDGAERLAAAVRGSRPLRVLLELDPGNRRTGARPDDARSIVETAMRLGLDVGGVFTHGGHAYRPGGSEPAGADEVRALTAGADALLALGIESPIDLRRIDPDAAHRGGCAGERDTGGHVPARGSPAVGDRRRAGRRNRTSPWQPRS